MASSGLRERKKARTRRLIADTAARLFAEHGYEHVAWDDRVLGTHRLQRCGVVPALG